MPDPAYEWAYQVERRKLLADHPLCVHCQEREATRADHQPPLSMHEHIPGTGCCILVPSCQPCEIRQAVLLQRPHYRPPPEALPEPVGYGAEDPIWDVPWLADLRDVPENATWPRLMTA